MEPVSSAIYETLMRQAIANGRGGARDGRGIGAGVPKGDRTHPLTAQAGEEDAASRYVNGKRTPAEPAPVNRGKRQTQPVRKSAGFDYVIHLNHAADNMPARKTTKRNTSVAFLTCMDGGRK